MDWKKNKINVAMQVLPEADGKVKYSLVDAAIEAIRETGFNYRVCPFETVVECNYDELSGLLGKVHSACQKAGTERMLTNLKIQIDFENGVAIEVNTSNPHLRMLKKSGSPVKSILTKLARLNIFHLFR